MKGEGEGRNGRSGYNHCTKRTSGTLWWNNVLKDLQFDKVVVVLLLLCLGVNGRRDGWLSWDIGEGFIFGRLLGEGSGRLLLFTLGS